MPRTAPEIEPGINFERRRYDVLRDIITPQVGRLATKETITGLEIRRRDELKALIAESLMGKIDTHYTFELIDGQLVAADGEQIEELLARGLRADIKKASGDNFYTFLPERSRAELDNFRMAQTMASGETDYNTLLETSVYNEEFDTCEENRDKLVEAAQKPYWGRTMVRLSHWDGQQLHIITLSSDNIESAVSFNKSEQTSSTKLFDQAVFDEFGHEFKSKTANGMLAEPISFNIQDGSWQVLAKRLVDRADSILARRHGGEWDQGRPAAEAMDLQRYVDSQVQAIDGLMRAEKRVAAIHPSFEDYQAAFVQEIYKCIALMELRLRHGRTNEPIIDYDAAAAGAGAVAQSEGKVYDACGMIISANGTETSSTAKQTGLESLLRLENKKIACPSCDKKVVVAKKYLEKGELHCNECGFHVDVCTGKTSYKKREKNLTSQVFSAWDIFRNWWQNQKREEEIKKIVERQAKAVLGTNVSHLDKKRYEKTIRQNLAA